MSKVYSYEDCQPVIKEAFEKAIEHLEETLGDQYSMNATWFAWGKFKDYVEQDIKFKMKCPVCNEIKGEDEFMTLDSDTYCCGSCFENGTGQV